MRPTHDGLMGQAAAVAPPLGAEQIAGRQPAAGPQWVRRPQIVWFATAIAVILAANACSMPQTTPAGSAANVLPPTAASTVSGEEATHDPVPQGPAPAAVAAAQDRAATTTELGTAVLDLRTGEIATGARGNEPFYTASLAKLVVVLDILDRRRTERLAVSDADIDRIRDALGPSDDSAMNILWTKFDGAGAAQRVSARLRLDGTTTPADPAQWGEMSTTAADVVRIFQYVVEHMPLTDRDLVLEGMAAAPPIAADGFNQAFGLLSPEIDGPTGPGAVAKQGWMCCFSGQYFLHSVGIVGADQRFVIALLARLPRESGWAVARSEVSAIAVDAVTILSS